MIDGGIYGEFYGSGREVNPVSTTCRHGISLLEDCPDCVRELADALMEGK